jgi:tetratricopeptide (TPR) repeat protein
MVMAPGKNICPYERTWCVYEAYCASEAGAKFEIAMSTEEHATFMDQCKKNPSNTLTSFFDKIAAENSRTSKVEDRVRIHAVIQEDVGFPQVNSALMTQHRDYMITTLQHELFFISGENTIEEANFIFLLATLHHRQGNYDEARPLYEECLQKRKVLLGNNHQDTLVSMNDLGLLYYQQGDYENAAPLYQEYYQKCRSKLGKSHPNTLISMSNLALLYKQQGKYDEAQKLYEDCLQRKKSKLGSDHPSTLVSMNNLALVYKEQGSYDDARRLLEDCLERTKSRLGDNHPSALEATRNLESLQLVQTANDEDKELNDDSPILETV